MITARDLREAAAEIEVLRWYHANGTILYDDKPRAAKMQARQNELMRLALALTDEANSLERGYLSKVRGPTLRGVKA